MDGGRTPSSGRCHRLIRDPHSKKVYVICHVLVSGSASGGLQGETTTYLLSLVCGVCCVLSVVGFVFIVHVKVIMLKNRMVADRHVWHGLMRGWKESTRPSVPESAAAGKGGVLVSAHCECGGR